VHSRLLMGMQGTRAGTRAGIKPHLNWSGNSSSNKDNAQHATSMVDKTAVINAHAASKIRFSGSSATEPIRVRKCSSCEETGSVPVATKADLIQNHEVPTQLVIIIPQTLLGDALETQSVRIVQNHTICCQQYALLGGNSS
jgi:hypothetical protein